MSNPTPRFTGLFIPVEVLNHPELTLLEQMLLSWIDALYSEAKKGCYASNDYFATKLKVKENTIAKALTSLRQKNLIEDVSFDGRHRVIRAKIGAYVEKCQSNPGLDLNPTPIGFKSNAALDENPKPTYIRDKSIDKSIDTPPLPPQKNPVIPKEEAIASEEILNSSSDEKKKRIRTPAEFSTKVKELTEKMVNALHEASPDWLIPKNLHSMMVQIDEMISIEKRDPKRIFDVFMWTINHYFWRAKLCKPNPAKYLREQFGQLADSMDSKPPEKSNQIDRRLRHKDGSLLDGSKEFEF